MFILVKFSFKPQLPQPLYHVYFLNDKVRLSVLSLFSERRGKIYFPYCIKIHCFKRHYAFLNIDLTLFSLCLYKKQETHVMRFRYFLKNVVWIITHTFKK